ncbi:MAG: pyridoxamine 5'-phosphate oxidase family protein, partial [Singulisphaera sp.]
MDTTHWRPCLTLALYRNRRSAQARYVQLATIREDRRPANRTVVFRGFVEETDLLIFTADDRSRKVEQVERAPWAEACWYFPDSREQFRLLGRSSVVRADHPDRSLAEARIAAWRSLSDAARLTFAWPEPGAIRGDPASFQQVGAGLRGRR